MPLQSRNLNTMGSSNGPSIMGGKKDSLRMPTTTLESSSSNTENKTSSQGHIVRRSSEPDGKVASTLAPKASMTRSNSVPLSSPRDGEDVIIEEKRKRASGDGYTLHRYLRGRLLGKGGFAKVYLCTALDTNKTYAVKIVPKANLVKARARQKVCKKNEFANESLRVKHRRHLCITRSAIFLSMQAQLPMYSYPSIFVLLNTASSRDQDSPDTQASTCLRVQALL